MTQTDSKTEVLLLNEEGQNLGRMEYKQAIAIARASNLDLVLMNKNDDIHVYKIMDFGKYKYNKKKHQKKAHQTHVKEMTFKLRIDPHDEQIKVNHIRRFLERGDKVKVTVVMKGRERSNPKAAEEKLEKLLSQIQDIAAIQQTKTSTSSVFALVRPTGDGRDAKTKQKATLSADQSEPIGRSQGNS